MDRKELLSAVKKARLAVPSRADLSQYTEIAIQPDGIIGHDGVDTVYVPINTGMSCRVNAAQFEALINKITEDEVELSVEQEKLIVSAGSLRASMNTSEDAPELVPDIETLSNHPAACALINEDLTNIKNAKDATTLTGTSNEQRAWFGYAHKWLQPGFLVTNQLVIASYFPNQLVHETPAAESDFAQFVQGLREVPYTFLNLLLKASKIHGDACAHMAFMNEDVVVTFPDGVLIATQALNLPAPDSMHKILYRYLGDDVPFSAFPRKELKQSVERFYALNKSPDIRVMLHKEDGFLTVTDEEQSSYEEKIVCEDTTKPFSGSAIAAALLKTLKWATHWYPHPDCLVLTEPESGLITMMRF